MTRVSRLAHARSERKSGAVDRVHESRFVPCALMVLAQEIPPLASLGRDDMGPSTRSRSLGMTRDARRTREIVVRSAIVGAAASAAPRPLRAAVATTTCLLRDALHPLHVLSQRFGNHHAAVTLLIVLENGHERATEGKSGTVDRVHESRFLFRCPITNVRATR